MKPRKGLLAILAPGEHDDDAAPESGPIESGGDDMHESKLDEVRALFAAMKDNDPEAGLEAFESLCEYHKE